MIKSIKLTAILMLFASIAFAQDTKQMIQELDEEHRAVIDEKAQTSFDESVQQIEFTSASLIDAIENLKIAYDRYDDNISSVSEVLMAQLYYQNACFEFIEAKSRFKTSEVALSKAVGEIKP